jgi:exodeoxyribonuclease V beta subunit
MRPIFDPARSPLENGVTVIEASAGTGKTTAICAIVLRLLAEREKSIDQILVTTYTELATAELRGRIRDVISEAIACAAGEKKKFKPFVESIVEKIGDKKSLRARLMRALHNFDEAPIFTIHGFCARVLAECTFETGVFFDCELITDQSRLWEEIADDFWRMQLYPADALTSAIMRGRIGPEYFVALLEQLSNNPRVRVLPEPNDLVEIKTRIAALPEDSREREALVAEFLTRLKANFVAWARAEMARRKANDRVQSFDDLLTQFDDALRSDGGAALRKSVRTRFAVALIDEFQDTDPVQYSIFSQIYEGSDAPVFFIGDPKQAIYGFRGADVFTYLKAARSGARTYTLGENWRSEAKLIEGVSAVFRRSDAFVIPGINLPPIRAGDEADKKPFAFAGKRDQPVRFWIAAQGAKDGVEAAIAEEIAELLSGEATIGDEKLTARDIAVLVTTNAQPSRIRNALARFRIPSVVYTAASVFKAPEAEELLTALRAIAAPGEEKKVRAALATEILGCSAEELEDLATNECAWEQKLNRFAQYHGTWRDDGFVAMMRRLLVEEKVRPRLLRWRDGERRLTNLLHLIELSHAACTENRYGMDGLIGWLETQIVAGTSEGKEEHELRLESDDAAVRIVTIHKSKGLEFPITFCPYARKDIRRRPNEFMKFHQGDELVLDLEGKHEPQHKREKLAELTRELYVGVTRAEHRSYVVWQERRERSKSALAWLSSTSSETAFLANGERDVGTILRRQFENSDAVAVEDLPEKREPQILSTRKKAAAFEPRVFRGEIDRSWAVASYSSLVSGRTREPETPDDDSTEIEIETEPLLPAQGIHAFPGGTRAGTCLHKILEQVDFQAPGQLRPLIAQQLSQFRISGFDEVVADVISRTLQIPLGESSFTLSEISARLPELEFAFPVNRLTAVRLQALLGKIDFPIGLGRLQFDTVNGFLKGFVDLVFEHSGKFYFLDWKSNWLGPDASFYTRQNLAAAMMENFYTLQMSIYALALHRYLTRRLPDYQYETNFGGAFYIFLRGIDHVGHGVFDWRPPREFIEKLNAVLDGDGNA